jgi:ketosteroid isomerase-like protein
VTESPSNESPSNKARVRHLMTEMAEGRSQLFFRAMSEDAEWHWMGVRQWSRTFKGKRAIVDTLFGGSSDRLPPSSRILLRAVHGDGDVVVVEHSGQNELPDGERYNNNYCWVLSFQDGFIKDVREYMDTQLVTETFGPDRESGDGSRL